MLLLHVRAYTCSLNIPLENVHAVAFEYYLADVPQNNNIHQHEVFNDIRLLCINQWPIY